jgi:UPF0042 nucleotide-binding protein
MADKKSLRKFFLITGVSGAGKTQALKILGDFGFYCVDNLPVALFYEFIKHIKTRRVEQNVAVCVDVREGEGIKFVPEIMKGLKSEGFDSKLLFFDAEDEILIRRFSETKHRHPLDKDLAAALAKERQALSPVRKIADCVIKTSGLTLGELKERVSRLLDVASSKEMLVSVISFGFKNGIPQSADLVMDVRFLSNPYYDESLRNKTGLDKEVQEYIMKDSESGDFLKKFTDFILYLAPKYVKEGKSYLTIAVGCTGGKHRSVFVARALAESLAASGFRVSEFHRDIKIEKKEVW